ncbi:MotA/TolQ/ExbB proton channel family protein [Marinicella sp. S1101]|uniref:MotA/TolQ/ExbB proton channel family protein n=1 Tax=Marinicella marina TaxID=2996016 RepID=UPI002260EDCB|nr:MotA/TolQ/ExbB proton channel family protein [Marinicella marina]MCX7552390.1 MotA/TolQ/ExbB proton channel family protein [Marinicella marina]MDJ1139265.1 MotA/TolQ/ExbB proton channel family protein [Marinicella marina]
MRNYLYLLLFIICPVVSAQDNNQAVEPAAEPLVPAADPAQAQQDLNLAYKKEYAFLTSQVNNIKKRLAEYQQSTAVEKRQIETEISALENQLLNAEATAGELEDEIFAIQRSSESAQDNQGLLESTIIQAQSTMSEFGFEGFPEAAEQAPSDLDKVKELVNLATQTLTEKSNITTQAGEFFLTDGTAVNGTIMKVGNIASYGNSAKGSGVLAPAGEKQFKVWQDSDPAAVEGLFNGNSSGLLPIFLYESSIKAIEEKQQKSILSVINSGGIIAWIIAALGMVALLLIILRSFFLNRASASTEKLLTKVVNKIEQKDVDAAIQLAHKESSSSSRVLLSALRNIDRDRDHIEDIVSESILHESSQLNRFGSMIIVIATVAPLLGLLGTVTGMISTFDIITEFGTGDPKLLSSGISIALVTTEVGLAVAIPALLFGNMLSGWAERIKDDMEKAALRAINVYKKVFS